MLAHRRAGLFCGAKNHRNKKKNVILFRFKRNHCFNGKIARKVSVRFNSFQECRTGSVFSLQLITVPFLGHFSLFIGTLRTQNVASSNTRRDRTFRWQLSKRPQCFLKNTFFRNVQLPFSMFLVPFPRVF